MLTRQVFRSERLDTFWRFVYKRQEVWYRRFVKKASPPWSDDPILQSVRFTNVYRELDPGTQFAVREILEQPISVGDKVFNIMIYRLIGREETFARIGLQRVSLFNPSSLRSKLKLIRDVENKPPFSDAYIVSSYVQMGSHDKIDNVTQIFSDLASNFGKFLDRLMTAPSAESAFETVRSPYGYGTFLAYQILVDLLYPLRSNGGKAILPFSQDDWAIAGPGAVRGLSALLNPTVKIDSLEAMRWLHGNQETEFPRLGLEFRYLTDGAGRRREISLSNIENCLCEFGKYINASEGGKVRRKFSQPPKERLTEWIVIE